MNLTYKICKRSIEIKLRNDNLDKEDMSLKLNIMFFNNGITEEEYEELIGMLDV